MLIDGFTLAETMERVDSDEVITLTAEEVRALADYMEENDIDMDDYRMEKVDRNQYEVWIA